MKNTQEYNKSYYDNKTRHKYRKIIKCEICNKEIQLWSIYKHNESLKHKYNELKQNQKKMEDVEIDA